MFLEDEPEGRHDIYCVSDFYPLPSVVHLVVESSKCTSYNFKQGFACLNFLKWVGILYTLYIHFVTKQYIRDR